jgi:hypothetical protein
MNVFWRPKLLHLFNEEYVTEHTRILAGLLSAFDIICLNEAFHFGSTVVPDFLVKAGFKFVVSCDPIPLNSYKVMDSGLLILSKHPIIERSSIFY